MRKKVKGYKVFNHDWTCRGFQYEVGRTFKEKVNPQCCSDGFHFCKNVLDCFNYYPFDPENKVAEVTALGDVDCDGEDSKCATNKIRIDRELSWHEVLELVNVGHLNTGFKNIGRRNSGNENIGNWNSGDRNVGDENSGDNNTGNYNSGNKNVGDYNSGDYNTGNQNRGFWNTGIRNRGYRNTWNCNIGHYNSGGHNTGDYNTGNYNKGCRNTGDYNTGNYNSGHHNIGYENSGDWNIASFCSGCFNTINQKLKFFDKDTDITFEQWRRSEAYRILLRIKDFKVDWVYDFDMTDEEKERYSSYKTTYGYLKVFDTSNATKEWWKSLTQHEKDIIRNIPNFDEDKFKMITGIDAKED